jgi:hypothetical protein
MKILCVILSAFFMATGWLFAGEGMEGYLDHAVLKISPVSTNETPSQAVSGKIDGYIERVDVWFGYATNTSFLTLFSSNEYTHQTVTIYEKLSIATNVSFYPRIDYQHVVSGATVGTNAAIGRIAMFAEKIYMIATNAVPGKPAQSITADIIYERR